MEIKTPPPRGELRLAERLRFILVRWVAWAGFYRRTGYGFQESPAIGQVVYRPARSVLFAQAQS